MKKEILWNDKKWIVDYETGTIYQSASAFQDNPNLLNVGATVGNYHFKRIMDTLYFKDNEKFYKVENDKVVEVSEIEFKEQSEKKELNINNPQSIKYISTYVSAIIVEQLIKKEYGLSVAMRVDGSNVMTIISNQMPTIAKKMIEDISRNLISNLPKYINRNEAKKIVLENFNTVVDVNNESYIQLLEMIYQNDKLRFDQMASDIRDSIERRKQINENLSPNIDSNIGRKR